MPQERRLAAILVADVVGFSRLVGADETGTLRRLEALRREVTDPLIAGHGGRLFKQTGDGFLVEFSSAVQAVSCARDIQDKADGAPLSLRIGIHLGDVVVQGDDLLGDGVNIAARLEGVAEPGGIALSRQVHDLVRDRIDAAFEDRGEVALKNIARPVHVFALTSRGIASILAAPLAVPDKPSIAVLPFQNMSGDPRQEYFADGMAEDILTGLSRFQNLFVIARNSSFTYRGKSIDVKKAGAELGVRYVLEGSIRATGDRVRITAQLADATTAGHVWAERYDRGLTDIFDIQDEVTAQIVAAIDFEVRGAEAQRSRGMASAGVEAWARYHTAFPLLFRLTREDNRHATELFDALRGHYPEFAAGHAGYGYSLTSEVIYGWAADRKAIARAAIAPCRQAVELDDKDAFCHFALGRALLIDGDRDLALASIDRAVARNPNAALAHLFRGMALIGLDRHAEALTAIDLALRLSPRDPGIWSFHLWRTTCHAAKGEFVQAIESARQTVRERPDLWLTHVTLAITLARAGRVAEGKAALGHTFELHPGLTLEEYAELNSLFLSPRRLAEILEVAAVLGLPRKALAAPDLALPDMPSIAVLPFQNMSGDPEQEYFADGIVEDIITALSRFKSLFVIARNSSFTYKGRAVDIKQVGRELGVRYVLEGSVRKAGNRVRITGQMIDCPSGTHLWADRFDGALEDVFELQDRVTDSIVGAIAPKVEQAEIERIRTKATGNLTAYDHFLRGTAALHKQTRAAVSEALLHYEAAIKLDPQFAAAHAWIVIAYSRRMQSGWMLDDESERAEAVRCGRRAIELASDDAISLAAGGFAIAFLGRDLDAGLAFMDRATSTNPNLAIAWHASGWVRIYVGQPEVAIEHLAHSMRLSPLDPTMPQLHLALAIACRCARRYDESVEWARKVTHALPDLVPGLISLATSLALSGRVEEARATMSRLLQLDPEVRLDGKTDWFSVFRRPEDRETSRRGALLAGMPE